MSLRVYDESTRELSEPFLLLPQLLSLSSSQCLKIELQGQTSQSDFLYGYLLESDGGLRKLFPNYGRRNLNHQWVFWRMFEFGNVCLLDLSPEKLFVTREDLMALMRDGDEPPVSPSTAKKAKKPRESSGVSADAQDMDAGGGQGEAALAQDVGDEDKPVAAEKPKSAATDSKRTVEAAAEAPKLSPRGPTILRLKQVMERTGLSRSTIYDKLSINSPRHDPIFPKQVRLGETAVGWVSDEIDSWVSARIVAGRS